MPPRPASSTPHRASSAHGERRARVSCGRSLGRGANYLYTNDKPGTWIVKRPGPRAGNATVFLSFIAGGTFLSYLAKQTRLWWGVEDVKSNESRCSCLSGRRHSGRRPDAG